MNSLSFNHISTHSVQFLQERIFDFLTPQQKKVGIIALAVRSFLAACFAVYNSCLRNKTDGLAVPPNSPKQKSNFQVLDPAKYGIMVLNKTKDDINKMDATARIKLAADILPCFPKDHYIRIYLGFGAVDYFYLNDKDGELDIVTTVGRMGKEELTKEEEIKLDRLTTQCKEIRLVDCDGQPVV